MRFQAGLECCGKTQRIGCSAAHDDKREGLSNRKERSGFRCRWGITIQLLNGEWSIKTSRLEHAHELPQDAIRALNGQKSMQKSKSLPISGQSARPCRDQESRPAGFVIRW